MLTIYLTGVALFLFLLYLAKDQILIVLSKEDGWEEFVTFTFSGFIVLIILWPVSIVLTILILIYKIQEV